VIAGAGDTPEYGETRPVRRFPLLPYGGTSAYWTAALDCARVRPMPWAARRTIVPALRQIGESQPAPGRQGG